MQLVQEVWVAGLHSSYHRTAVVTYCLIEDFICHPSVTAGVMALYNRFMAESVMTIVLCGSVNTPAFIYL